MSTLKAIKLLRDKDAWRLDDDLIGCERLIHDDGYWFYTECSCVNFRDPDNSTMTNSFLGFPLRWMFSFRLEKDLLNAAVKSA